MIKPADPESTIRKKAGKTHYGYIGSFAESADADTNRKIIDFARLEQNIYSYAKFCKEELKRMHDQNDTSDLYVDGACSRLENISPAKITASICTEQIWLVKSLRI